jgi:hypothetical protein
MLLQTEALPHPKKTQGFFRFTDVKEKEAEHQKPKHKNKELRLQK